MSSEIGVVYQELLRLAKGESITNYTDVGRLIGLNMDSPADRNRISEILDEISSTEDYRGNPLLSAVVVLREQNIPGEGFFKLAKGLKGAFWGGAKYDGNDDLLFWLKEIRRVHDHWSGKN